MVFARAVCAKEGQVVEGSFQLWREPDEEWHSEMFEEENEESEGGDCQGREGDNAHETESPGVGVAAMQLHGCEGRHSPPRP